MDSQAPYKGILVVTIIIIILSIAYLLDAFQVPDTMLYDLAIRHSPSRSLTAQVLLITVEPKDRDADDQSWLQVLETLKKLEARQILFTFLPPNTSARFYQRAIAAGNVLFGRDLIVDPSGDLDALRLQPWPAAVSTLRQEPPFGVVTLPPANNGIYRRQYAWHTVQDQQYPALEIAAMRQLASDRPLLAEQFYWVNFQGGAEYLPVVGLSRLLKEGLIPELVRGRSVLIGLLPRPLTPGLHTPLERWTDSGIPLLVFQGYALETLLRNQPIQPLSLPWAILLLTVAVITNLILYQSGGLRFRLAITSGFLLLYLAAAWLMLTYTQRWLPVTALAVMQIIMFTLVSWHKALVEDQELRALTLSLSSRIREQALSPGFYATSEPWKQVVVLVQQMLDLRWLIFLERIPNQFYVREIAALDCQFSDISERRRDYRRSPYSDAIAKRRTILLEGRLFLKTTATTIDQYLGPLLFGGELLGFWAMGVSPEKATANPDFFILVEQFRDQIAEMLYHRLQWQQQSQKSDNRTLRYLRLEGGKTPVHTLRQALLAFERRSYRMEQVFQGIETAAIFYNPFGRLLQINEAMTAILRQTQVPAYEMTALDLLTTFCTLNLSEGRQALQRVFIQHQTITYPAKGPEDALHRYLLRARPILIVSGAQPLSDATEALPFQLQGILIELIDITALHDLSLVKTELTERVHHQLRDHFQAMLLALDLPERSPQEERRRQDRLNWC